MTAAGIEIGDLKPAETELLFGLAKSAFETSPGWTDGRVLAALEDDVVFVAREGGVQAGYVALRRNADEGLVIEQLLVVPGHEHRGVGHRLLAYAEGYAIAQGAPSLLIVAEPDNHAARGFYVRAGFVPVGGDLLELVLPRLA
ncbi:MAG: GNAT family N-acetyltransferase [Gaiellaceae bacterium]